MSHHRVFAISFLVACCTSLTAQVRSFPFVERFDSVSTPSLPDGWSTSTNRLAGGDFFSTTTSPHSPPHSAQSTNSTVPQFLLSPTIDFGSGIPAAIEFWITRSGSHTSSLVIEASVDNGLTFPFMLGDTLLNPGSSGYRRSTIFLPLNLSNEPRVRFRWRLVGDSGGSTGTFRIDDISITTYTSYDLALGIGTIVPAAPSTIDDVSVSFVVHNKGVLESQSAEVMFYLDSNDNHKAEESERFDGLSTLSIPPGDSTKRTTVLAPLDQGHHRVLGVIQSINDENAMNDTSAVEFNVSVTPGSLVINEIMYEPLSGESEWFELYNPGAIPIDIRRWTFTDGTSNFSLPDVPAPVSADGFAVISSDSTILSHAALSAAPILILNRSSGFGFGNSGDDLILKNAVGTTIDSVRYSPAWHQSALTETRGRSLERINPFFASNDPHNWSTSADRIGATPGARNSIFTRRIPATGELTFSPNPFSPDADGFEDFCIISYKLPHVTSLVRITIFDLRGRRIRTLANSALSGDHGELIWDGEDDKGRSTHIGPYILLLEAVDGDGGHVATLKGVIVVATKL